MPPRYTPEETESLIAYLSHPTRLLRDPNSLEVFAELGPGSRKHLWSQMHKPEGWRLHFSGLVDGDLRVLEAARKMHNRYWIGQRRRRLPRPFVKARSPLNSEGGLNHTETTETEAEDRSVVKGIKKETSKWTSLELRAARIVKACQVLEAMRVAMRDGFESFDDEIDEEQRSSEAEHESEDSDDEKWEVKVDSKPQKKVSKHTTKRPRDESEDEEAPPPKKQKKTREPPVLHRYAQIKSSRNAAEFSVSKRPAGYDRSASPARRSAYSSSTVQDDPDTSREQKNRRSTSSAPGPGVKKVPGVVPPRRFYDTPPLRRAYRGELDHF
ncbi:hypothetical protein GGX14DRAFT_580210 [Mycena pura]|uniref:Uncharacterized protein n=1 Tax=Mycena pura TaxID=153505 RepID=A0AAD6UQR2_9AGAR|nr:hypothetical protein GGX14DRAFT_580210 [Mycena pura]